MLTRYKINRNNDNDNRLVYVKLIPSQSNVNYE